LWKASWKVVGKMKIKWGRRGIIDVGRNGKCPCGSGKKFKRCCYPHICKLERMNLGKEYEQLPK